MSKVCEVGQMNNGVYLDVGEFLVDLIWTIQWFDSRFTIRIGNFEFGWITLLIISSVVSLLCYVIWGRSSDNNDY